MEVELPGIGDPFPTKEEVEASDAPIVFDVPTKTRKPFPRISANVSLYHSLPNENPTRTQGLFSCYLKSEEEPYRRRLKITDEWHQLDLGWVGQDCSYIIVENVLPKPIRTQAPEPSEEIPDGMVYLGFGLDHSIVFRLPPGHMQYFWPEKPVEPWIRCESGETRIEITVIPE